MKARLNRFDRKTKIIGDRRDPHEGDEGGGQRFFVGMDRLNTNEGREGYGDGIPVALVDN